jgi:hypothetical protein
MAGAVEVPWGKLAVVAGGALAFTMATRAASGVAGMVLGEVRDRAVDSDAWLQWFR